MGLRLSAGKVYQAGVLGADLSAAHSMPAWWPFSDRASGGGVADADDPFDLSELAVHFLEERDPIRFYGDDYRRYRQRAPMISPPRLAQRKSREIAAEKRM